MGAGVRGVMDGMGGAGRPAAGIRTPALEPGVALKRTQGTMPAWSPGFLRPPTPSCRLTAYLIAIPDRS